MLSFARRIVFMLAVAVGTTGCAMPVASAATFDFWYALGGKPGQFIQDQCKRFNQSQSEHHVNCVFQGDYGEVLQKTIAAYRARKQPALIQVSGPAVVDMQLSGAIVPIEELTSLAHTPADWGDLLPPIRAAYSTAGGRLLGQPYNASTLLFFTNDTLLQKAGVTVAPRTWEDVEAAARKLKAAGVACPMALDFEPWRILEQFSAAEGAPIATEDDGSRGLDARYVFDRGPNVRFISDLARWHRDGLVRLPQETQAGAFSPAFDSGECAMIMNSTGAFAQSLDTIGRRDRISPHLLPIYAGTTWHKTNVGGAALFVMKGFDAATLKSVAAFLAFVRRPEEAFAMTVATGYLPITRSSLQMVMSGSGISPEMAAAMQLGVASLGKSGADAGQGLRVGFYVRFEALYVDAVSKVFQGSATAEVALSRAREQGDELLRRFEETYPGADLY